jgi:hypothetical protein
MQDHNAENVPTDVNHSDQFAGFTNDEATFSDPIVKMLLRGEAATVSEAEEKYLDANIRQVIALVESPMSDEAFRAHPLIVMLLSHGSREWEDSLW